MPRNRVIVKVGDDEHPVTQNQGISVVEQLKELYSSINDKNLEEEQAKEQLRGLLTTELMGLIDNARPHLQAGSHWHITAVTNVIKTVAELNGLNKPQTKPIETSIETEIKLGWSNKELKN